MRCSRVVICTNIGGVSVSTGEEGDGSGASGKGMEIIAASAGQVLFGKVKRAVRRLVGKVKRAVRRCLRYSSHGIVPMEMIKKE
jgi:hypothetical protein